jgi:hypothetical protein
VLEVAIAEALEAVAPDVEDTDAMVASNQRDHQE